MLNIRTKGHGGEREVVKALNLIVYAEATLAGFTPGEFEVCARNLAQTDSGGCDISAFGFSIEIKRQETLCIDKWWLQTVVSAERNNEIPVLLYRQNHKGWKAVLNTSLFVKTVDSSYMRVRGEITWEDFQEYFKKQVAWKFRSLTL